MKNETRPQSRGHQLFNAWKAKDFEALRGLMVDGVTFRGPMGTADGADVCIKGLSAMAETITDIAIQKIFIDGPDVLTWYDLHTAHTDPLPTANCSHHDGERSQRSGPASTRGQ